jgi:plastocyanin
MNRKSLVLSVAFATVGIMAAVSSAGALGGTDGQAAGNHTVILKNIRFRPATLSIRRDESVKWVWEDGDIEHNVTFHGFHSRTMTSGSYTVRFTQAGTFNYNCTLHASEGMKGKIVVH